MVAYEKWWLTRGGRNGRFNCILKEVVECYFSFPVFSIRYIYRTYNEKGKCTPIGGAHKSSSLRTHNLQKPSRLYWDITPKLAEIIENAVRFAQKVADLLFCVVIIVIFKVALGLGNPFNFLYQHV